MTKEEVRSVSLSKLRLQEDSICYDVEREQVLFLLKWLFVRKGQVYAIEKKRMRLLF